MRVFIYNTSKQVHFEGLFEPIGSYQKIFLSNDARQIELFNRHSGAPVKELLPEAISSDPTDETICCIPPNDDSLFFIPSKMKGMFLELLKSLYKKTELAEYQTTIKPPKDEIGLVGSSNLSRFYDQIKIQAVISSDKIDDEKPPVQVKLYRVLLALILVGGFISCGAIVIYYWFYGATEIKEPPTDQISTHPEPVEPSITATPNPPSIDVKEEPKNVTDWATLLVQELKESVQTPQNIYLNPLTLSVLGEPKEPVDVFDSILRDVLAKSTRLQLKPLTQLQLGSITLLSLRQRAKREASNEGMSLAANLLNADSELNGEVQINKEQINIEITLTNNRAEVIAHATVEFPQRILAKEIITQAKEAARPINPPTSQGELKVEIATSHGVHNVTYHAGEFLRLFIRTNQPAYVYVFVADVNKHVTWLYPESLDVQPKKVKAGELFILPEDSLPYELIVQAPFGSTILWVVALTNSLKLPTETNDSWFQIDSLRDKVRTLGLATADGYAEAEMVVETIGQPAQENGIGLGLSQ